MRKFRFLRLLASSGLGQGVGILCSLLVPYVYTPEALGVYGIFLSASRFISSFSTGNLDATLYTTSNPERQQVFFWLPVWFLFGTTALTFFGVVIFGTDLSMLLGIEETFVWWFLPPLVFIQGIVQIGTVYFNATHQDKQLHALQIVSPTFPGIGKLLFSPFAKMGLVWGHTLGLLIVFFRTVRALPRSLRGYWKYSKLWVYARHFRSWWGWGTPSGIVNLLGIELLFFITQKNEGAVLVGFLTLGFRYLKWPVELLNGALMKDFLHQATGQSAYVLKNSVFAALKKQVIVTAPFFLGVYFFAPTIVVWFWGAEWEPVGAIAQTFALFLFVHGIGSLLAPVADLLHKVKWEFVFVSVLTLARVVVLFTLSSDWWTQLHYFAGVSTILWCVYGSIILFWLFRLKQ